MNLEQTSPLVSVIVPAYNAADTIPALVSALRGQDYPIDKIEILIVDNNSTDNTQEIIHGQGLPYLREDTPGNSYAARNRAIENSKGELLAFTDADCRPAPDWIKQGVRCLQENGADMAAGHSVYAVSPKSVSGRYSRSFFGRQKYLAESHGACATNNLFMRRKVVETMGKFDQRLPYGEDTRYTAGASENGFRMVYCPNAIIYHAAHAGLKALYRKWWRTGFGEARKYFVYGKGEYALKKMSWYLPGLKQLKEFRDLESLTAGETVRAFFIVWMSKLAYLQGYRQGSQQFRTP